MNILDSFETADFTKSLIEARVFPPNAFINNHQLLSDRSSKMPIAFTFMNSSSQDSKSSLALNVRNYILSFIRVKEH